MLDFKTVSEGDTLPELAYGPVTHSQLVRYSGASGDFNPIHTVPEVAQEVGLPGIIAHGMLVMAVAGKCITDWAGIGSFRAFKVRFRGMTHPGERLICKAQISKTNEDDRTASGRLTIEGEDGSLKLKGDFTVQLA